MVISSRRLCAGDFTPPTEHEARMASDREKKVQRPTFRGIQALRGFAACMVVIHHATLVVANQTGENAPYWINGGAGVDVFFAISGFVMAVSTIGREHKTHPARSFLERRLIRLVPLYWMITALMFVKVEILRRSAGAKATTYLVDTPFSYVLSSLLFVPYRNSVGTTWPLLAQGWTLSFEMLFYLLFAAALALRVRVAVMLTPLMMGIVAIGLFHKETWPTFTTLADPLLLEFLAGLLLGQAAIKGFQGNKILFASLGVIALPALLFLPSTNPPAIRVLQWGLPAYLLVHAAVAIENRFGGYWPRWVLLIGDASYSLYLSHGFVVSFILNRMGKMHLLPMHVSGVQDELIPSLICLIVSILVAIPLYLLIEEPTTNFLRRKWLAEGKPRSNAVT
jgi:exopolysaccharide production protein ExoZ